MKTAIICIAKNEDAYITEWCTYHLKLGFSHIFIYENDWRCTSPIPEKVTLIPFDGNCKQVYAYNDFILTKSQDYDFGLFIDVDEFLTIKDNKPLTAFLERYAGYCGVGINWRFFGDSGQKVILNNNFSLINRFIRSDKDINRHIKTLLNFKYIREHSIKNCLFCNPHFVTSRDSIISTDCSHYINGPFNDEVCDDAIIHHYYCKTFYEYVNIKRPRGFGDKPNINAYLDKDFERHNFNTVFNLNAYNFYYDVQKLKRKQLIDAGCKIPTIKNIFETASEIVTTNKSLCRFGDGELKFLSSETDTIFEKSDERLRDRLKEILVSDDNRCMIAIYRAYLYNDIPVTPNVYAHQRYVEDKTIIEKRYDKFFNQDMMYYASEISVVNHHYNIPKEGIEFIYDCFKEKFKNKNIILVTGDTNILKYEYNILTETSKSVIYVEAPIKNSFSSYDDILNRTVSKAKEYDNVIACICLGHTGTVLAYDLATKYDILSYDIGHLPKEYDCFKHGFKPCSAEETKFLGHLFFAQ